MNIVPYTPQMKPIKELFHQFLPADVAAKAVAYHEAGPMKDISGRNYDVAEDLAEAILRGFDWDKTVEGSLFWQTLQEDASSTRVWVGRFMHERFNVDRRLRLQVVRKILDPHLNIGDCVGSRGDAEKIDAESIVKAAQDIGSNVQSVPKTKFEAVRDRSAFSPEVLLDLLPEPYRSKALANSGNVDVLTASVNYLSEAVALGFYWPNTPEGSRFWNGICDKLILAERAVPSPSDFEAVINLAFPTT